LHSGIQIVLNELSDFGLTFLHSVTVWRDIEPRVGNPKFFHTNSGKLLLDILR